MKLDQAYSGNVFIASGERYEEARAVIFGMPMDFTVSFRPGSRFGPARIREASVGLEEYSPYLDKSLEDIHYFDAGDLVLPFGNAARSMEIIGEYVKGLFADGKFPLGLGGEHLVTWPIVREAHRVWPELTLVHIDAHADLREHYEGEELSHATPVRKAVELLGGRERIPVRHSFRRAGGVRLRARARQLLPVRSTRTAKARAARASRTPAVRYDRHRRPRPVVRARHGHGRSRRHYFAELLAQSRHCSNADCTSSAPTSWKLHRYTIRRSRRQIVASKLVREILLGFVR